MIKLERCKMHPLIKIILFILVVFTINLLREATALAILAFLVGALAMLFGNKKLLSSIYRMRWLWLSLLLIYGFSTPGEYIRLHDYLLPATYEGLHAGWLQIVRLLMVIAMINGLFSNNSRAELLSAVRYILIPLKYVFDVDRFSLRLFLTLEYVEQYMYGKKTKVNFFEVFESNIVPILKTEYIAESMPKLRSLDFVLIGVMVSVLCIAIFMKASG